MNMLHTTVRIHGCECSPALDINGASEGLLYGICNRIESSQVDDLHEEGKIQTHFEYIIGKFQPGFETNHIVGPSHVQFEDTADLDLLGWYKIRPESKNLCHPTSQERDILESMSRALPGVYPLLFGLFTPNKTTISAIPCCDYKFFHYIEEGRTIQVAKHVIPNVSQSSQVSYNSISTCHAPARSRKPKLLEDSAEATACHSVVGATLRGIAQEMEHMQED